ncbi:helix-turn-helix transcriptional regulator [Vibrio vulnificus]|uniref:helix-turn-helix transcriptional regulator n=1 Tax=Vibrio vulnificus TaxID=672 RepID=UPI0005F12AFD
MKPKWDFRVKHVTAAALAEEIGDRLKQARLNRDLTQSEVAEIAGIARKTVLNAEKGKVQLDIMIAILMALDLTEQIDLFIPKQEISPIQLAKLQGKKRQRASGQRSNKDEETPEW